MEKSDLLKTIKKAKEGVANSLLQIVDELRALRLKASDIQEFSFKKSDISSDDKIKSFVDGLINQGKISNEKKWIYLFTGKDLSILLEEFKSKRRISTEKFAKANAQDKQPACIYVGSSNKFARRIEEHLGRVSDSTYAIRFSEWLPKNVTIQCFCFEVNTQKQDVLQELENGLWNRFRPIIGKRGGK